MTKRINITIDEKLLKIIDDAAQIQGMSRSAFLAESARKLIENFPRLLAKEIVRELVTKKNAHKIGQAILNTPVTKC
jgi:metal-responsive CopG/Arc/MetJ family transcriptional regulator